MASFKVLVTSFMLLVILVLCEAGRLTINEFRENTVAVTPQEYSMGNYGGPCHPNNINIQQEEVSGVGIPIWKVQIMNLCTNPQCMISQVVVQCGQFHSPRLVNPNMFKRLDSNVGTCIVNNGGKVGNAQTITFQYSEIWKQPLTLKSAKVTCW